MNNSTLVLNAAAVADGVVEEVEFAECMALFQTILCSESRAKTKNVSLVPTTIVKAAAESHGRSPRTVELLRGMNQLSRQWLQLEERETLAAQHQVDYVLEAEIEEENEEIDEGLMMDLATEILVTQEAYEEVQTDTAKLTNLVLSPIPPALAEQLRQYEQHRTAIFSRHREGAAVTPITIEHDKSATLRFISFCVQKHAQVPSLELLASPRVGEFAESYLTYLRQELRLMASSLSNYTNSILAVSTFAQSLVDEPPPLDELTRLRRQCESLAKQDKLFAHRDKNWLSWLDSQKARVAALEAMDAASPAQKLAATKTALIICFHTLQCPDRVGVVRCECSSNRITTLLAHPPSFLCEQPPSLRCDPIQAG